MNRLLKGSIAGAAGLVLLLGGAGTFAYWNDQVGIAGGPVTAGQLDISDDGVAGVWRDQTNTVITPATFRVSPGDTLTYTDQLTVTASGINLVASLALTGGAIAPANPQTAADVALASFLTANAVLTATGTAVSGTGPYTIRQGTGVVTVTVTIPFPIGATATNSSAMLGAVTLSNMSVALTQNH